MAGRPPKSTDTLRTEKKSHRTKAELETREEAEKALLSGEELYERPEVRKNKVAHKEFRRVAKLMKNISKNDALYSSGLNTYCQLYSEILGFQNDLEDIDKDVQNARKAFAELEKPDFEQIVDFTRQVSKLVSHKIAVSSSIDRKRNMMLAIEKENVMTISAALRSIPKNPQDKQKNPIWDMLNGDGDEQ